MGISGKYPRYSTWSCCHPDLVRIAPSAEVDPEAMSLEGLRWQGPRGRRVWLAPSRNTVLRD